MNPMNVNEYNDLISEMIDEAESSEEAFQGQYKKEVAKFKKELKTIGSSGFEDLSTIIGVIGEEIYKMAKRLKPYSSDSWRWGDVDQIYQDLKDASYWAEQHKL